MNSHEGFAPENKYHRKYIYLVLVLVFVAVVIATYLFPVVFPQAFVDELWTITEDTSTGQFIIKKLPGNTAMVITQVVRNIGITGLVGVLLYAFYEHRFEREEKQELYKSINYWMSEQIETHLVKAMVSEDAIEMHIQSTDRIQEILKSCLKRISNDSKKADALHTLIDRASLSKTVDNLHVTMTLTCFDKGEYSSYEVYKMTYSIHYKVKCDGGRFRFILTDSKEIQNQNLGTFIFCQFIDSLYSGTKTYFHVGEITIDGIKLQQIGDAKECDHKKEYIYWNELCDNKIGKEVQVYYTVEFLVRKFSNHYSYFTPFMSNGIDLRFDASSTDIKRIKYLPYLSSKGKPTVVTRPEKDMNPKDISINLNEWVLPDSGVSFIWQYEAKTK